MSRCYVCNAPPQDGCMAASAARAAECPRPPLPPRRSWRLQFECDGAAFNWTGQARTADAARWLALDDLAYDNPGFSKIAARLVACVEG